MICNNCVHCLIVVSFWHWLWETWDTFLLSCNILLILSTEIANVLIEHTLNYLLLVDCKYCICTFFLIDKDQTPNICFCNLFILSPLSSYSKLGEWFVYIWRDLISYLIRWYYLIWLRFDYNKDFPWMLISWLVWWNCPC